jgi:hypothetical protein
VRRQEAAKSERLRSNRATVVLSLRERGTMTLGPAWAKSWRRSLQRRFAFLSRSERTTVATGVRLPQFFELP